MAPIVVSKPPVRLDVHHVGMRLLLTRRKASRDALHRFVIDAAGLMVAAHRTSGNHEESSVYKRILVPIDGSDTETVLRESTVPVLLVRAPA